MKDLYYFEKEKTLIWITGYGSFNNLKDRFEHYSEKADILSKLINRDTNDVCHLFIENSSRFERMNCFYLQGVTEKPEEAMEMCEDWTVSSWIRR